MSGVEPGYAQAALPPLFYGCSETALAGTLVWGMACGRLGYAGGRTMGRPEEAFRGDRRRHGQTLVEYAMILALVALVAVIALRTLVQYPVDPVTTVANVMDNAT